ncbi:hypothetical protein RFI_13760 [Reticulomyxa filosa]|uniref:Uncharacterized protein n=1 Tax=Reticulomyxa filosa TaxID=46433 RepID=X6NDL8_RETFI|nr:hypothetical protein RFI_13760 [Reticulomyxa filosa]|eukprot:ETO23422.1 hypothetical protein RFI_13760 [Reticulomyxa filosa]
MQNQFAFLSSPNDIIMCLHISTTNQINNKKKKKMDRFNHQTMAAVLVHVELWTPALLPKFEIGNPKGPSSVEIFNTISKVPNFIHCHSVDDVEIFLLLFFFNDTPKFVFCNVHFFKKNFLIFIMKVWLSQFQKVITKQAQQWTVSVMSKMDHEQNDDSTEDRSCCENIGHLSSPLQLQLQLQPQPGQQHHSQDLIISRYVQMDKEEDPLAVSPQRITQVNCNNKSSPVIDISMPEIKNSIGLVADDVLVQCPKCDAYHSITVLFLLTRFSLLFY